MGDEGSGTAVSQPQEEPTLSYRPTCRCLRGALIELMSEKELGQISITELVTRANVSRATFYRNYTSKEDLMEEIRKGLMLELAPILRREGSREDAYSRYLEFFSKNLENKTLARNVFSFQVSLEKALSTHLFDECRGDPNDADAYYRNVAFEGAFLKIVNSWVVNDMPQSPEEMAALCCDIL